MWASTKIGDPFFRMVFVYSFVLKDLKRRSKILIFSDPLQVESRLFFIELGLSDDQYPVDVVWFLVISTWDLRCWIGFEYYIYIYIVWISEVCFQSSKIGISVRRFHYFGMGGSTSNQKMFGNHGKKQTYIRLQRVDGKWSANFQAVQVGRVIRRSGSPSRLWQKRQWQSPASAGATLLWACKQHLPSKP